MTNIAVTEDEFLELFPGRYDLYELLTTKPKSHQEFVSKYLPSKLWRLNNLYLINDKSGNPVIFKMNRAQFIVYSKLKIHWRLIILKSRQQGISTLFLITYMDDAIFRSNLNCGLMAQDREAASTLLERVKYTWDNFDDNIKEFLQLKQTKDNASEVGFSNGSALYIRTSFRSGTLQRLHISELGKIANKHPQKAKETKTGTLQAISPGNFAVVESTAEGENMFKQMWQTAKECEALGRYAGKDFMPIFLSWLDDPDCVEYEDQVVSAEHAAYFETVEKETGRKLSKEQKNFWIVQERELEGDIHQEYPATPAEAFAAAKDGSFWARKYLEYVVRRRQILPDLYDSNLPVYTAMDLGRNDTYVVVFFQFFQESNGDHTIRIVGEYYNSGEGLDHYVNVIKNDYADELGWDIDQTALPHDAAVTDLSTKGNRSRQDILAEEGLTNTIVLDKIAGTTSRENVRQQMPHIWIDEKCTYLQSCFLRYSKEWNDTLNVWRNDEKHDEYSHGAAGIRYMVQYCVEYLIRSKGSNKDVSGARAGM